MKTETIKTVNEMRNIINTALDKKEKVYYAYSEFELFEALSSQRITNYIFIGNDIDNMQYYKLDSLLFARTSIFKWFSDNYTVNDPFIYAGYVIREIY